ncbi:unnamed protein product [Tetraodon nigroviridis]|uniref:(spotted green pufferfish) hypothetical protein n=1 Tax=Tetraodon nigroviridis TaxID=99883 RepID=Q4RFN4_TETNG|nr:unnamed protein product [Tetraodon nigroviridis]
MTDSAEAGHQKKLPTQSQSVTGISSVRNFGDGGTPIHDDRGAFKDCNMLDDSLVEEPFYDRNSQFLKCDNVAWEDLMNGSPSETLPSPSLRLPATPDLWKAAASFDTNRASVQHLSVYNGDVPRWPTQTSLAEPQYWCQPAGLTEDPFLHNAYDGMQNQAAAQGNLSSAFPR